MKIKQRYLFRQAQKDLKEKMVFIGGPRQIGKTTLAKELLKPYDKGYLSWDNPADREKILKYEWPKTPIIALDELHKYHHWRNLLKGLFDDKRDVMQILVTGSARLDLYRRGGDSLQGRYHYLRMHPLSVAELGIKNKKGLMELITLGGFPEPFFKGAEIDAKRWSREYRTHLIRDDVISLEKIQDLGHLELLMLRMPDLVGSPLSINAIREDMQVSHKAIAHWVNILENLYAIFRLSPFGAPHIRAIKKEQKHYHFDWTLVKNKAIRFENLVACHLLKWVHFRQDVYGENMGLRYFRDRDGHEVDFIITEDEIPKWAIECKWDDAPVSKGLKYLATHFRECETWQISAIGKKDYQSHKGIRVAPAITFLKNLL